MKLKGFLNFKLFILTILLVFLSMGFNFPLGGGAGSTYYVDATSGADGNTGLSEGQAWQTINKVNGESFSAGNQILFKRGEIWREQLTIPSSGDSNDQITFGAYGSGALPIINGSDLITPGSSWSDASPPANSWSATLTTEPSQVFFDGVRGTKESDEASLSAEYEWFWDANVLYVYSTSDPDTAYTSPGIEASVRSRCIRLYDNQDYITLNDIHVTQANTHDILIGVGSSNLILDGLTISYAYRSGINAWHDSLFSEDIIVQNCTVNYCGGTGIYPVAYCKNWTIANNTVHDNAQYDGDVTGEGSHLDSGGIRAGVDAINVTNITIESNTIYNNGSGVSNFSVGHGITIDTVGSGIVIRYNTIYDNAQLGIVLELQTATQIYYNVLYDNVASGIRLSRDCHDNLIYNNVIDGSAAGIEIWGDNELVEDDMTGNLIKNNICSGNGRELRCLNGGENDGTNGSGNVYIYNCLGAEAGNFIEWGNGVYKSTYDTWESAYGSSTNSVEADPLMTDPASDDFTLQSTSPCIDVGVYVGLSRDYAGAIVPRGVAVDIGAYEYLYATGVIMNVIKNVLIMPIRRVIIR